jgi:vacuolar-type H+-ATPase subunit H
MKKVDQPSAMPLSLVDQIWQTEADVTRRIAATREKVEQILENSRKQSEDLKRQAYQTGIREGQARYREIINAAEEESRAIIAEARDKAEANRRRGQQRMNFAVNLAVNIVIGLNEISEGARRK